MINATTGQPGVHASRSKLMLQMSSPVQAEDESEVRRLTVFGTIEDGYLASEVSEQLWQCELVIRPESRKTVGTEVECGPGPEIRMPARMYLRPAHKNDGTPTLMVAGVGLGDFRSYPSSGVKGDYGIDEIVSGSVDIIPVQRWDGTKTFHGRGISDVLTSYEFQRPEEEMLLAK